MQESAAEMSSKENKQLDVAFQLGLSYIYVNVYTICYMWIEQAPCYGIKLSPNLSLNISPSYKHMQKW